MSTRPWITCFIAFLLLPHEATPAPGSLSDSTILATATLAIKPVRDLLQAGHYAEAEAKARERLRDPRTASRAESIEVAVALDVLAEALLKNGRLREAGALSLVDRALKIKERALGLESPETAVSLALKAKMLVDGGKYAAARECCERALAIRRKALGEESREAAQSLTLLGGISFLTGDDASARRDLERAIAIQEKVLGPDAIDIATTANSLANVVDDLGDMDGALKLYQRALTIDERILGPDHPDLTSPIGNIGYLYFQKGDLETARKYYERSLRIHEHFLRQDHPAFAWDSIRLGELLDDLGDYETARAYLERALSIWEKTLGPQHENVGWALTALGVNTWYRGDSHRALPYLERSLAIRERALGPDHEDVAYTTRFLGLVRLQAGDYKGARPYLERTLAIREKAHGPNHLEVATSMMELADLLGPMGEKKQARDLLEKSLRVAEKVAGPECTHVEWILTRLADMERDAGDSAAARAHYERSIRVVEKAKGAESSDMAWVRSSYAELLEREGNFAAAREQWDRTVSIREKSLGGDYPGESEDLTRLASALERLHEPRLAFEAATRAEHAGLEPRRRAIRGLSEREGLEYASQNSALDLILSSLIEPGVADTATITKAWDAVIQSRALVLDEIAGRHRSMGTAGRVVQLAEEYAAVQQRLAALMVQGAGDRTSAEYLAALDRARHDSEERERELGEVSASFQTEHTMSLVALKEVSHAIPYEGALLAYARYDRRLSESGDAAWRDVTSYIAFTWEGRNQRAHVVPLGPASVIDSLVGAWRRLAGHPPSNGSPHRQEVAYRVAGEALRQAVWDPVASDLSGSSRIMVVPDGTLSLVNLATLPVGSGEYLVDEDPVIHYMSSERDLVQAEEPANFGHGLLAVGAPDFDERSALVRSAQPAAPRVGPPKETQVAYRGPRIDCPEFDTIRWKALPATSLEIREAGALWVHGAGGESERAMPEADTAVVLLIGRRANEARFKKEAPGKRVIHLATHGFFLGTDCIPSAMPQRGIGGIAIESAKPDPAPAANPMLLSGLALAGANQRGSARSDQDDGILTAEEIGAMDLSSVEWAVLSACDTGVGEVRAGEGVLGLRRAFQIAGVRTLIMSLWPVDDEATRRWMRSLYEGHWLHGRDTAESVRDASRAALQRRRANGESTHPFYWGAFVAAGRWR